MRIQLRPYQAEAIDACREVYDRGLRYAMIVLATGLGKTVVFSHLVRDLLAEHGPEAIGLVLAHRNELLTQAADKYRAVDPEELVGIFQGDAKETWARVICASVPSCYGDKMSPEGELIQAGRRRLLPLPRVKVVVIDECHHTPAATYLDLLDEIERVSPDCVFLGVTATPFRGDGTGLGVKWQCTLDELRKGGPKAKGATGALCFKMNISQAWEMGYLVPASSRSRRMELDSVDMRNVEVSKRTRDFKEESLAKVINTPEVHATIVQKWMEHAGPGTEHAGPAGRPTVVFCAGIQGAKDMAEAFNAAGVKAGAVWGSGGWLGGREVKRAQAVAALPRGEITVLCNCQVLTEGWDESCVSCITIARPTKSQVGFAQMVGRGLRLLGTTLAQSIAHGKPDCLILDFVGASAEGIASMEDLRAPMLVPGIEDPPAPKENPLKLLLGEPESAVEDFILSTLDPELRLASRTIGVTEYAVDLFGAGGQVAWAIIDETTRVCSAAHGLAVLVYRDRGGTFTALAMRDKKFKFLAERTTEIQAVSKASAFALLYGDPSYLKPGPWFTKRPATADQMRALKNSVEANRLLDNRRVELARTSGAPEPKLLDTSRLSPAPSMAQAMAWLAYLSVRVALGTHLATRIDGDLFSSAERSSRVEQLIENHGTRAEPGP